MGWYANTDKVQMEIVLCQYEICPIWPDKMASDKEKMTSLDGKDSMIFIVFQIKINPTVIKKRNIPHSEFHFPLIRDWKNSSRINLRFIKD